MNCSICFENFDDEKPERKPCNINPCGHCFCSNCLNYLSSNTCPKCRRPFTSKSLNWALLQVISEKKQEKMNSSEFDLFFSFQFNLKDDVKKFIQKLKSNRDFDKNVKIYLDDGEIDKTNNSALTEKTTKMIKSAKVFISFLTIEYAESINCIKELEYAHNMDKEMLGIFIDEINIDIHRFDRNNKVICFDQNNSNNSNNWFEVNFDSIVKKIKDNLKVFKF